MHVGGHRRTFPVLKRTGSAGPRTLVAWACWRQGGSGALLQGGGAVPPDHVDPRVDPGSVNVHEDAEMLQSLHFEHVVY